MNPEFYLKLTRAISGKRLDAPYEPSESVAGYYRRGRKSASSHTPPPGKAWITTDKGKEYEVSISELEANTEAAS